jgi:hypothetical protein
MRLIIHHHLGLGDHFVCNGLVRFIIDKNNYEQYYIPAKEHNFSTVKEMYSDLNNVEVVSVKTDNDVIHIKPGSYIKRIGFEYMDYSKKFDKAFYDQLNLPLSVKRTYFKINRNSKKEQRCYDHYAPLEKYIFVHDKTSAGEYNLKIETNLPIVKPEGFDFTLTDYLKLIEDAEEVHCLDSSFSNMIDLSTTRSNLFFHEARGVPLPLHSDKWISIKYGENE